MSEQALPENIVQETGPQSEPAGGKQEEKKSAFSFERLLTSLMLSLLISVIIGVYRESDDGMRRSLTARMLDVLLGRRGETEPPTKPAA